MAAGATSRGVAARWSKPGSANPLCVATTGGICGCLRCTASTCSRKAMPVSESRNQPLE